MTNPTDELAESDGLSALPEPAYLGDTKHEWSEAFPAAVVAKWKPENRERHSRQFFTADQMREYARACLAGQAAAPAEGWVWMTHPDRNDGEPIPVQLFAEEGELFYRPFDESATDFAWDERDSGWQIVATPPGAAPARAPAAEHPCVNECAEAICGRARCVDDYCHRERAALASAPTGAQVAGEPVAWYWEHVMQYSKGVIESGFSGSCVEVTDDAMWNGKVATVVTELHAGRKLLPPKFAASMALPTEIPASPPQGAAVARMHDLLREASPWLEMHGDDEARDLGRRVRDELARTATAPTTEGKN